MAAVKRLSLPASPRISEAGKITNMYRSVVVETGCSLVGSGEQRIEISLVPEESTSSSSRTVSQLVQDSLVKLPIQSSSPSPTSGAKPV
ncbi:UNVERIFIED_CONTAM: hypothetical protein Sangu_1501800 [Sesamum angustifolium]|uniref:Uncharacterized protein n=1 Tax=Sesamum angustifolium TaxID=2727405 RepID=A0AAW2MSD8_9LAMI